MVWKREAVDVGGVWDMGEETIEEESNDLPIDEGGNVLQTCTTPQIVPLNDAESQLGARFTLIRATMVVLRT